MPEPDGDEEIDIPELGFIGAAQHGDDGMEQVHVSSLLSLQHFAATFNITLHHAGNNSLRLVAA